MVLASGSVVVMVMEWCRCSWKADQVQCAHWHALVHCFACLLVGRGCHLHWQGREAALPSSCLHPSLGSRLSDGASNVESPHGWRVSHNGVCVAALYLLAISPLLKCRDLCCAAVGVTSSHSHSSYATNDACLTDCLCLVDSNRAVFRFATAKKCSVRRSVRNGVTGGQTATGITRGSHDLVLACLNV